MASVPRRVRAKARSNRSNPFTCASRPKNSTSGCCPASAAMSAAGASWHASWRAISFDRIDPVRHHGDSRQPPAEFLNLPGLDRRRRMDRRRLLQARSLDQGDPGRLDQAIAAGDQRLDQHATRRNDIWYAPLARQPRRPPGRPQESRMQMDDVGARYLAAQGLHQCRRVRQAAQPARREIPHLHAVQHDRPIVRHRRVDRPIDAGGEHLDGMAARGERPAQAVHRDDRSAIPRRRQVGRHDVQDLHRWVFVWCLAGSTC